MGWVSRPVKSLDGELAAFSQPGRWFLMGWSGKTHGTLEEDGRMGCFGRPVGSGIQGCGQAVWPRKIDLNIPDARVGNLACNETLDFLHGFKTHSFYDVLHEFPHCFHLFPHVFPSFLPSLPWISPWFAIVFSMGNCHRCFSRDFPVGTGLSHPLVNIQTANLNMAIGRFIVSFPMKFMVIFQFAKGFPRFIMWWCTTSP